MHNWKWVNLSKMAGFNISLSLNERQSSSDKKRNKSLRLILFIPFCCCFAGSLPYFFIDSETNETIPLHFRNVFHFSGEKNSLSKAFLVECVRSGAASCNKRRQFWRETRTPLWLLIGRIIFLTREKPLFAILIGRIVFFTCENHRSLLWLARTNLRTKIYDIAFWWVFLSMYIIKGVTWQMWRYTRYIVEVEGAGKKVCYTEFRVRRVVQTRNGIGHSVRSCTNILCSHAKVIRSQ